MTEALEQLTAMRAEVDALRTQMREKAKQVVKEGTESIFEQYGDILHSFGWTQYTPYFNDGDPCVFSMGELALIAKVDLEGKDPDLAEDLLRDWSYEGSPAFSPYGFEKASKVTSTYGDGRKGDPRYDACLGACKQVYEALDNATAEDIFGDHVRVVFTADGVEVEDYDHE